MKMNIQQLTTSEKIMLVEQLWDSVRAESQTTPLTNDQQQLLDERLQALEVDGDLGANWEDVLHRVTRNGT
jgi:putative addiction module component (TIGR02574 family)